MTNTSAPETFKCQLTGLLMKDPVMDKEGNNYERDAITAYLNKNKHSPVSNNPLQLSDLFPNKALKTNIEAWLQKYGQQVIPQTPLNNTSPVLSHSSANSLNLNDLNVKLYKHQGQTVISIIPPERLPNISRTPTSFCCVIDVSGSMGVEALIQSSAGNVEGFGLSVLDLVKHSVRTIIEALEDNDNLSIITFDNSAKVVLPVTQMNSNGKKMASMVLDSLNASGSTNIWDGLIYGLDTISQQADVKNNSMLLLTDGQSNVNPPRGIIPMLEKYKADAGEFPTIINTAGFGYDIDSRLLNQIAGIGKGSYSFIPDGGMVGTIFVNHLSNVLSTAATNVSIDIHLKNSNAQVSDYSLIKHHTHNIDNDKVRIELGSINFGQPLNIVLPISYNRDSKLSLFLRYKSVFTGKDISVPLVDLEAEEDFDEVFKNSSRLKFANYISKASALDSINNVGINPNDVLSKLANDIKLSALKDDPYIKDLIQDIEGQATLAISTNSYFHKWGKHYLPSLAKAHMLQQCNNFKDPGVQHYGGALFRELRDYLDKMFLTIPPPKPSIKKASYANFTGMGVFHNSAGICFDGNCSVKMFDGSTKLVKEIKKGDKIKGNQGKEVVIKCVLKTEIKGGLTDMVQLKGGLRVTPYHPIRINGKFFFPMVFGDIEKVECPFVYNFVLDNEHLININGYECVTLGHNFDSDETIRHPYFGSQKVVEDLSRLSGWRNGLVEINNEYILRDPRKGIITGIRKPSFIKSLLKSNWDWKNKINSFNLSTFFRKRIGMIKF